MNRAHWFHVQVIGLPEIDDVFAATALDAARQVVEYFAEQGINLSTLDVDVSPADHPDLED